MTIDYPRYIDYYFHYSPETARRTALKAQVPWRQVVPWEREIREEYMLSFSDRFTEFSMLAFN